jgi:hypothetical protein
MMVRFEDREVRGPVSLWLISRLEGERSKGQTWKAKKHECEDAKGHTWKGQRHRGSVWVMRQVIVRMKGPDGLIQRRVVKSQKSVCG